ncbi:ATP-binding protein [Kitasatospora nipponensis]
MAPHGGRGDTAWGGPGPRERLYDASADELEVRRIRHWLVDLAGRWWPGATTGERDAFAIVAAELLANVVRHAPGRVRAALLDAGNGTCVVAVADQNPVGPAQRSAEPGEAESGLGLLLVQELSTAWGWHPVIGGKVVWAHLSMSGGEQMPA